MMDTLNPYSVDDLLNTHGVMTRDLVKESGYETSFSQFEIVLLDTPNISANCD